MKGILATPRTLSAIRAADALARNLGGGKMRKGTPQIPGGGEYSGPFAVVDSSSDEE